MSRTLLGSHLGPFSLSSSLSELIGPLALMTKAMKALLISHCLGWPMTAHAVPVRWLPMLQTPFLPYLALPFLFDSMNESSFCIHYVRLILGSCALQGTREHSDYIRQYTSKMQSLALTILIHKKLFSFHSFIQLTDARRQLHNYNNIQILAASEDMRQTSFRVPCAISHWERAFLRTPSEFDILLLLLFKQHVLVLKIFQKWGS